MLTSSQEIGSLSYIYGCPRRHTKRDNSFSFSTRNNTALWALLVPEPYRYDDPELHLAAASYLLENGAMTWSQTTFDVLNYKDW